MLMFLCIVLVIISLLIRFVIHNTAVALIENMVSDSFYSESEQTLDNFVATKPDIKKASLIFLTENCLNQSIDAGLVSDKQQYKEMKFQELVSNMTYFDIHAITICYEKKLGIKKFSLKRDTFFEMAQKYQN